MKVRDSSIIWGVLPVASAAFGLAVLAGVSSANAVETFRPVKGPEIRSRLTGMEFTDEVHWALLFGHAGTLTSISMGKKTLGRWRVKQDQLCLDRSAEEPRCYAVWSSGRAYQLREPDLDIYEEGVVQRPGARR